MVLPVLAVREAETTCWQVDAIGDSVGSLAVLHLCGDILKGDPKLTPCRGRQSGAERISTVTQIHTRTQTHHFTKLSYPMMIGTFWVLGKCTASV